MLPNVLNNDLEEEVIGEVIKFADKSMQGSRENNKLEEESYNTEQLVRKRQMKFNADNCGVNHRQKIHLTSYNKMKGSELITAIQEKAPRIIRNSCKKIPAPNSKIKANARNYLEWNKTKQKISLGPYVMVH